MELVVFGLSLMIAICFMQDWWDCVKNELVKPGFDKKRMGDLFDDMHSSLGDRNTGGHGMFRKKFIQVCSLL